jgi:dipeptide/tripeptide permease
MIENLRLNHSHLINHMINEKKKKKSLKKLFVKIFRKIIFKIFFWVFNETSSQAQNDLKIFIAIVHNKRFALHKKIRKY